MRQVNTVFVIEQPQSGISFSLELVLVHKIVDDSHEIAWPKLISNNVASADFLGWYCTLEL